MVLLSAREVSARLGGVPNGGTIRRWALEGRIKNARRLPSGRVVFLEAAVDEILSPVQSEKEAGLPNNSCVNVSLPVVDGVV